MPRLLLAALLFIRFFLSPTTKKRPLSGKRLLVDPPPVLISTFCVSLPSNSIGGREGSGGGKKGCEAMMFAVFNHLVNLFNLFPPNIFLVQIFIISSRNYLGH